MKEKLKWDLADVKVWNDEITWKKREHADQKKEAERKRQEDADKEKASRG